MDISNSTIVVEAVKFGFKGKGSKAREEALASISALALIETQSRDDTLSAIELALGAANVNQLRANAGEADKDSDCAALLAVIQTEWIIGRVAAKLAKSDLLKGMGDDDAGRLASARELVTCYAAPAEAGKTARKLRKHQTGRRTVTQHKAIRAAESAWSLVKADLGFSQAKGLKADANGGKRTRGASANKTNQPKADATPPATTSSPTALAVDKVLKDVKTADQVMQVLLQLSTTAQDVANKYAKVCPTDAGTAVATFRKAILAAANALQERNAKADAVAAAKSK